MKLKRYLDPNESPQARRRRLIVGSILCLLGLLFCLWAGGLWWLCLPLLADAYFTRFLPWGWHQRSSKGWVRSAGRLVDDVLFAVLGVTFLNIFFFQNFVIPSSSLEKTLLIGDYLFVDKLSYGPRTPMTPLAIPLVHNSIWGHKAYLDEPSLPYRRLKGFGKVERNDIVVFNFPAGDTVALNMPNPDYYTLQHLIGREAIHRDKAQYGEVVYRPIDMRDHYVKRCVGLPGERLELRDAELYIDGRHEPAPKHRQLNYCVQTDGTPLSEAVLDALEINYRDVLPLEPSILQQEGMGAYLSQMGFQPLTESGGYGRMYLIPLTDAAKQGLLREPYVRHIAMERTSSDETLALTYPLGNSWGWTMDNYGPILIPKAGMTIPLTEDNLLLYSRCIVAYEGHRLETSPTGQVLIDGVAQTEYTFAQDYYFMMGDNRHNSADSRAWGFVPEDHIVGKPALLWLSINSEKGLFSGGIRWGRMFRWITGE